MLIMGILLICMFPQKSEANNNAYFEYGIGFANEQFVDVKPDPPFIDSDGNNISKPQITLPNTGEIFFSLLKNIGGFILLILLLLFLIRLGNDNQKRRHIGYEK